jgi:hypothetical protein
LLFKFLFIFGPLPSLFVSWDDRSGFDLVFTMCLGILLFAVSNDLVCLPDVVSASGKIVITERIFLWLIDWKPEFEEYYRSLNRASFFLEFLTLVCLVVVVQHFLLSLCIALVILVFQGTPWLDDGWILWSQFVAMELLFSLVILSVPCKIVGGLEARTTEAFCIYHNFVLEGISY